MCKVVIPAHKNEYTQHAFSTDTYYCCAVWYKMLTVACDENPEATDPVLSWTVFETVKKTYWLNIKKTVV